MNESDRKLSSEEWMKILLYLEEYHAVFSQLWRMGQPKFTEEIDTSAVMFDDLGGCIDFLFNPKFWDSLDETQRLFVICHECLHVVLNHGKRTTAALITNRDAVNQVLDVVVNHSLVRGFGFERDKLGDIAKEGCWVDTVFKNDKHLRDDLNFEQYYDLLPKVVFPKMESKKGQSGGRILDDHGKWKSTSEVIKNLNKALSKEEKDELRNVVLDRHSEDKKKDGWLSVGKKDLKAGSVQVGEWTFVEVNVKIKKKWEILAKKVKNKIDSNEVEQWARINRRFSTVTGDFFLPTENDDEEKEKTKASVYIFLDHSGSCANCATQFFRAARSIPTEFFDIRLFSFDTVAYELNMKDSKLRGGGGTTFSCIEEEIQIVCKGKYPEMVFVITDGGGNAVVPEKPQNWYWFLTENYNPRFIPEKSKRFLLHEFE